MYNTIIKVNCVSCKKAHELKVVTRHFKAWKNGMLIQTAFPYLKAEERELLISGICPKCWKEIFSPKQESTKDIKSI